MAKMNVPNFPMYPVIQHEKMREYSDGIRFGGGLELRPAPYLPVVEVDRNLNAAKVIKKGTFVTLDEFGYVVPAFVGKKTLTYGQYDVEFGVLDIDLFKTTKAAVTAAKTSTAELGEEVAIGKPIGVAMFDIYQWDMGKDPWYQVQDQVTILADRMILLAVDSAHASVQYQSGDILVLNGDGFPVPFDVTVVVTGKPDVKVGGAETEAAVTLAQPADNKVTVANVAEVSWVGEPTWRSNYSLKVTVDASKNASVYLNGSETPLITGSAATGLYIPQHLGLTVKALNDTAEQTAYFKFQVDDTDVASVAAAVTMLKDMLKYKVGRLVKVIDLAKDTMFTGGLENVEYWPSEFAQGLPGKQNGGVTDGIDKVTKKGLLIQLEF